MSHDSDFSFRKEFYDDSKSRAESKAIEYDPCVICGCPSPYTKDTHVDMRAWYHEGAGQLCSRCHEKIC